MAAQAMREARARGRESGRVPGFGPLLLGGPLPAGHPLEDTLEDRRRLAKRMRQEARGHR